MTDHDRLFKELITTFFIEFIELFFPSLAAYIDKASFSFLDKEIFTDVTAGERHEVDVLARVKFLGQDAFFLVHVENQAQDPGSFPERMFRYFGLLHSRHKLPVYPIAVFSHDSTRLEADAFEVKFPDLTVLRFQFRTVHLRRLNWRDYLRQANPVAAALMTNMGMAPEERPRVKLECLRLLTTLRLNPAKLRLISGFIDTYLRLTPEETLQFQRQADNVLGTGEKAKVMELTTSWKEEGRIEMLHESIQDLLEVRFGTVPLEVVEGINRVSDIPRLKQWHRLAATVTSLREFAASITQV